MSIDRRPSGRWRVRHPGVPSKTFDRKQDAEEYERQIRRVKQTGRVEMLDADLKTLAELAGEHIAAVSRDWSDKTWDTNRNLWAAHVDARILNKADRQWFHPIADMTLRQLRPTEVEKWKNERLAAGAGPQAIRKTMALMQSMLDRAVRDEILTANPVKVVKKPSGKRAGIVTVVAPEAVERIRSKLDDTGAMLVSLLAYTGMRPGEARALRWEHIRDRTIRVEWGTNPDGSVKPTKTEEMRTVRLLAPLAADLKTYRTLRGDPVASEFVFPRDDGRAWTESDYRNWRSRKFIPAAAAVGVKICRAYDLRHSAASLWLHEGTNPVQVAQWLGHNVSETFKTYAHVLAELDPTDRTPATKVIEAARKVVFQDISRTHGRVQPGAARAKSNPRNRRSKAKSAV